MGATSARFAAQPAGLDIGEASPKTREMNNEISISVRTQPEIIARYKETLNTNPDERRVERLEYTRIMSFHTARLLEVNDGIEKSEDWAKEFVAEIDYSAKALLRRWETKILTGGSLEESKKFTQMYVAFKWMLGHEDSDVFPGAIGSFAGQLNAQAFQYVKDQILSGRFNELTYLAIRKKRGE
jgi:hypothetical protein